MKKEKVVFGFLGNVLDQKGKGRQRWNRWRPTVSLCLQEEFPVNRLELLYFPNDYHLACRISADIQELSSDIQINLIKVETRNPWDFEEVYTCLLDVSKNYIFDTDKEAYGIHITTGTHVAQICWFLLAEARFFPAQLIQTSPPPKRIDTLQEVQNSEIDRNHILGITTLIDLNLTRYDQIMTRLQKQTAQATSFLKSGIATKNSTFNKLIDEIECISTRSKAPILLEGPTGAGKSFLAKRIYELKVQQHQIKGAFIEVNCATLRGDSAMSTLFGHVKGAFTGADKERAGLLKLSDQGVLFLDEIGELGLDEQAMLLKAVEEKKFYPFGSDKEISSYFQLIAGTHHNLRERVKQKLFREDLYARINLWSYQLPGLAGRKEDIEPNLEYELTRFAKEYGQMPRFSKEAKQQYLQFATSPAAIWSGNFRELTASISRMSTLASLGNITIEVVGDEIKRLQASWQTAPAASEFIVPQNIDLFDVCQLKIVIEVCQQSTSLSEAGRKLFSISRTQKQTPNDSDRLRKYLAKFDLSWNDIKILR